MLLAPATVRLILYFALAMIAIYLVRRALHKPGAPPPGAAAKGGSAGERMVACVHCGVHIPESECVRAGDRVFCSVEHRRLHHDGDA